MDERELEELLAAIGREEYVPSERLLRATAERVRGTRLLRAVVFLSLCLHLAACCVVGYLLLSPDISTLVKVYVAAGCVALVAAVVMVAVAARQHVAGFFRQLECAVSRCPSS